MLPPSICFSCARLIQNVEEAQATCRAFPKGIPKEITDGVVDHREPYAGDHGLRWQLADTDHAEQDLAIWLAFRTYA